MPPVSQRESTGSEFVEQVIQHRSKLVLSVVVISENLVIRFRVPVATNAIVDVDIFH